MPDPTYDTITVEVPNPPKALHPNSRTHWRAKIRPKQKYRDAYEVLALEATKCDRPEWATAKVRIRWYGKTHSVRQMDQDNARLREALEPCFPMAAAWATQYAQSYLGIDNPDPSDWAAEHIEAIQAARQALNPTEPSK